MKLDIVGYRRIALGIALALVLAGGAAIGIFGLKQGTDFTGGTLWEIAVESGDVTETELVEFFRNAYALSAVVHRGADAAFLIRTTPLSEADHTEYRNALTEQFGEIRELRFESIGPSIGRQLRRDALIATVAVLLGISLYVAFVFRRAGRRVASWKYGVVTLATLFHDILIPLGVVAVLGAYGSAELDTNIVIALLVIAGFSVHDTIVVFDRIREHSMIHQTDGRSFAEIINTSVSETFARSVNTSLTLAFVLVALLLFGPPTLFFFSLTILIGTMLGTYSSLCVASPLLFLWSRNRPQEAGEGYPRPEVVDGGR